MLQDNPLLVQLKRQLRSHTLHVEGVVKSTEKGFGFLEIDAKKSYFIPPLFMKRVMHGDKISAIVRIEKKREIAEPAELIEPFLTRFVGRVQVKNKQLSIIPDHPFIKEIITTRPQRNRKQIFRTGDWAVAKMCAHPLKGDSQFYAEIISLVTRSDDNFAPWWVTLARYNLERVAPTMPEGLRLQEEGPLREDLTSLDFITIDKIGTKDMDDALYMAPAPDGAWTMTVAIADPTAWVSIGSSLDNIARERAFTNYLPGFNIPMLPHRLSDDLCSLREHQRRPALVCRVTVRSDGTLVEDIKFFTAWIESKGKLTYDNVSDWLEKLGSWQPATNAIASQIHLLYELYLARRAWRQRHALVFKDRPSYRFVLDENGNVDDIVIEPRRIAHQMIEEAMILANICAARVLRDKLGYGLYNVHHGFDPLLVDQAVSILRTHQIQVDPASLLTLEGFCNLRRKLNAYPSDYLDSRIRRFQTFTKISTVPGPHFGLGLDAYATWTSPMRKYGDMTNHRLLKSLIGVGEAERPNEEITCRLAERRRKNRVAKREVNDWLYARFLKPKADSNSRFTAEIIDISRGGMRVRLLDNGAIAFVPAHFIHSIHYELVCSQDTGTVQVNGEERYRQGDILEVTLAEVRIENRSVIARPA